MKPVPRILLLLLAACRLTAIPLFAHTVPIADNHGRLVS
jgi:hypothetical protein